MLFKGLILLCVCLLVSRLVLFILVSDVEENLVLFTYQPEGEKIV